MEEKSSSSPASSFPWTWVVSQFFMAVFFGYAARVQLNDPDWELWFSGYTLACLTCLQLCSSFENSRRMAQGMSALTVVALISHMMNEKSHWNLSPRTEVGRESLGLIITAAWFAVSVYWYPMMTTEEEKKKKRDPNSPTPPTVVATAHDNSLLLPTVAAMILLSVYFVPSYILRLGDTPDHCAGLGFSAGAGSSAVI